MKIISLILGLTGCRGSEAITPTPVDATIEDQASVDGVPDRDLPSPVGCMTPAIGDPVAVEARGTSAIAWASGPVELGLAFAAFLGGDAYVWLQRVAPDGALLGRPIAITTASSQVEQVGIATDGERYVVCAAWGPPSGMVRCGSVPLDSGIPTCCGGWPGQSASVAFGSGGFVIAYTDYGDLALRVYDTRFVELTAMSHLSKSATGMAAVVATASGFAVSTMEDSGVVLYRLDASGTRTDRIGLAAGGDAAQMIALAVNDDRIGATWIDDNRDAVTVVTPIVGSVPLPVTVGPNAMSHGEVGMAGRNGTFASTWSTSNRFVGYRSLTASGEPEGEPTQFTASWDESANAIVAVPDGFLLAFAETSSGPINIHHLLCP